MPESLIVDDANVDVGCELLPCDAGVHRLVSIVIVPCSQELFAEVVDGPVFLREPRTLHFMKHHRDRCLEEGGTYSKGVASWASPCMAPALPAILSTNIPMVIRLGNACGLMMMSGCIPLSENGMSTAGHFWEQTPFCPWRDENLSPMTGERVTRKVT